MKPEGNLILLSRFSRKLGDRAFAFILALMFLLGMIGVFLPIALTSIRQVVQKSELLDTEKEIQRVLTIFQNELDQMEKSNRDWSGWDETYQFAQDGNQDFIDNNLSEDVLSNLGINLFLIVDQQKQIKVVRSIDLSTSQFTQPAFEIDHLLSQYPELFWHVENRSNQGVTILNGQAMLITSLPVLTSQLEGPLTGSLVFGIYLDQTEQSKISTLTQRNIHFWSPDQNDLPGDAAAALSSSNDRSIQAVNAGIIRGYQVIPDLSGKPAVLLGVDVPRDLYQQANSVTTLFAILFSVLSLILAILVYRFLFAYLNSRRASEQYHERLGAIFKQSNDAIVLVNEEGKILDANATCSLLLGITSEELLGSFLKDVLLSDIDPWNLIQQVQQSDHELELRCRIQGKVSILQISMTEVKGYGYKAFSLVMRDVTAQKADQAALQVSEKRYQLATMGANDGIWDWNIHGFEVFYSARWKAMLGYEEGEISNSPLEWFERIHPDDLYRFQTDLDNHLNQPKQHFECECRMRHKDGSYRWMLIRGLAQRNAAGYADRMAGSLTDITLRKEIEEQLRYDALHDHLTGLANRILLLDRISHINDRKSRKPQMSYALLFLDLDRFKQINDNYGHKNGDQVLIEVARRLQGNIRAVDTISRTGGMETLARIAGDEFVILLEDLRSPEDVEAVAQRILEVISQPISIDGVEISVHASIGIVVPEQAYDNVEDIIRDADIAMYKAKEKGGGSAVRFTRAMYEEASARMRLENDLQRAVERNEFLVYYQPIFALLDDHIIGFEALVRWQHPDQGLLLPGVFIQLAEETGLIIPIGYQVLAIACQQMRAWQLTKNLDPNAIISINLSARQLTDPELIPYIQQILYKTGLPPTCLWLEITETTFIENLEEVRVVLEEIRKLGIRIEIDDFGVGYSSLSYLHNLPIDGFKIDRSFVNEITRNGEHIVSTLVELGHNLRLLQVAEGVETREQKEFLQKLECDYVQGYLMSKPVSSDQIEQILIVEGV